MQRIRLHHAGRPASLLFIVLFIVLVTACGSAASLAPVGRDAAPPQAAPSGAPAAAPGAGDDGSGSVAPGAIGLVDDARIVRTGTMDLEVSDVNRAVATARDAIRAMGGYVGASTTTNEDDQPLARITYRIPVDRWEDALAVLRALNGLTTKVVVEQTEAVEVTGQIVDLQARIRNLRASESALQAIAANAAKISDVLEVQAQLTRVRGEIEQLSGQLTDLGQRADFATLTTSFATAVVAVQVAARDWDPTAVVDEASASMVDILQGLAGAGIWFAIVWLPILVTLTIVAIVGGWILRRLGLFRRSLPPVPPVPPMAPPPPPDPIAVG